MISCTQQIIKYSTKDLIRVLSQLLKRKVWNAGVRYANIVKLSYSLQKYRITLPKKKDILCQPKLDFANYSQYLATAAKVVFGCSKLLQRLYFYYLYTSKEFQRFLNTNLWPSKVFKRNFIWNSKVFQRLHNLKIKKN